MAVNFTSRQIIRVSVHGTVLVGVQNADLSDDAGGVVPLNGDGQLNIEDVFVDNRQLNIGIAISDPNQVLGVLAVGDAGEVQIDYKERPHSDASAVGASRRITIPATVITNLPNGLPHEGVSSASVQLAAAGPGGAALYSIADI